MLGDAGTDNSDVSYAGANPGNTVSLDYVRSKIVEFQSTLQSLDRVYRAALDALQIEGLDEETIAGLQGFVSDYEGQRFRLLATSEALNAGAAAFNALGGRMPVLSIPSTLGMAPAIPIAMIWAVATAATLITWGNEAARVANSYLMRAQLLKGAPESSRVELARVITESQAAVDMSSNSGISALAPYVKWAAIGGLAFLAWRAYSSYRASNPRDDLLPPADEDDE